jgi:hypothetical protein
VVILQRGEQGVVVEPCGRGGEHAVVVNLQLPVAVHAGFEVMEGPVEQSSLVRDDFPLIHLVGSKAGRVVEVGFIEEARRDQLLGADEVDVARERGGRRIGRAAIARGAEGHDLPERLTGGGEVVDEPTGFRAEVADAEWAREGRRVWEDAARALDPH